MVDRFSRKMFLSYATSFKYVIFILKCQLCFFVNEKYVAVTALDELAILLLKKQLVKLFPLITLYLKVVFFFGNTSLSIDIPIPYFAQNFVRAPLRS